jgi:thiosulfate/3-mercaptopyruvate sulfurtransferase
VSGSGTVYPVLTPLIDVDQLVADTAALTLLDVRWEYGKPSRRPDYVRAHIPGARFVDLDTELCGPPGSAGRRPLPEAGAFSAAMRRGGVTARRPVVVYDGDDSTAAARAWWLLRYFGHPNVRVLDGGFAAWRAAGLPVRAGSENATPGDFQAHPGTLPVIDDAGAAAMARRGVLLDARPADRYAGARKPTDSAGGHIPGAVSAPTVDNVAPDGRFHPPEVLRARFESLGLRPGTDLAGVYCGSGIIATHEILALSVAGIGAALYPGSWSHWTQDPRRPVATGIEPG